MHLDRKHRKKIKNLADKTKYEVISNKNETIYYFPVKKNHIKNIE